MKRPSLPISLKWRITKRFSNVVALDQVDFRVRHGEVHALIGENGAGKSTLIKILSGAYHADSGVLSLDGKRVTQHSPAAMQRLGIAVIYQELNLVPHLSVARNIFRARALPAAGRDRFHNHASPEPGAARPSGHRPLPQQIVADLGIAEQQFVEIAKALSRHAKLLVMDEPTAPLSEQETAKLFDVVRRLVEQGVTIIYISHRLEEIFTLVDRVTVLRDGRVVGMERVDRVTRDDLVRMMVGRDISQQHPKVSVEPGEVLLRVTDLPARESDQSELTVRSGEIVALAGLVGSGRTELARQIFGAETLRQGRIEVKGRPLVIKSTRQAIRAGIGMVPEDRKTQGLILDRSVTDNITLPILGRLSLGPVVRSKRVRGLVTNLVRHWIFACMRSADRTHAERWQPAE